MRAPSKLGRHGKKLWRDVVDSFDLDAGGVVLLELACRHLDRLHAAQDRLDVDGIFVEDRFGQVKTHPGVAVVRDASIAVARCLRELGIDAGEVAPDIRPPRIGPRSI